MIFELDLDVLQKLADDNRAELVKAQTKEWNDIHSGDRLADHYWEKRHQLQQRQKLLDALIDALNNG